MTDRTETVPDLGGGVVVGHDGSAAADRALVWAAEEARLRQVPLHVVRAWTLRTEPRPSGVEPGVVPSVDDYAEAVRVALAADVGRVLGGEPPAAARLLAVHGHPADALLRSSASADLVVVGSRGVSGVVGLVLGSTSEAVVRHARCPVVVVRDPTRLD